MDELILNFVIVFMHFIIFWASMVHQIIIISLRTKYKILKTTGTLAVNAEQTVPTYLKPFE